MSHTYLDEELFEELKSILDAEFPTLVRTFIQDSALRVQEVRQALAQGSADGLRKAAHSLKGASSNLGLVLLAEECRLLEEAAREGRVADQAGRVDIVARERDRAVEILQGRL